MCGRLRWPARWSNFGRTKIIVIDWSIDILLPDITFQLMRFKPRFCNRRELRKTATIPRRPRKNRFKTAIQNVPRPFARQPQPSADKNTCGTVAWTAYRNNKTVPRGLHRLVLRFEDVYHPGIYSGQSGLLSLTIPSWVGAMSTGDSFGHRWGRNGEFCVAVSRAVFVKFPKGVRCMGFDIRIGTFGYEHLVEGCSQCWSLHPGGSTGGGLKSTPWTCLWISVGGQAFYQGVGPPESPGRYSPGSGPGQPAYWLIVYASFIGTCPRWLKSQRGWAPSRRTSE